MSGFELGFFTVPVLDLGVAKNFFGAVMGWTFQDRDPEFTYIFANGNMIGSFEKATERLKPSEHGPLLYFRADFMERTLERVTAHGGSIIEKQAMDGGARGYTARVLDPFKNSIGFWAPEN